MSEGSSPGWLGCILAKRWRLVARSLTGAPLALALLVACVTAAQANSAKPTLRLSASPSIVRRGGVVKVSVTGSRRNCTVAVAKSRHVIRRWTTNRHRTQTFRVGNRTGAITITVRCGHDTRIAPVWVVSDVHASSIVLGYQPAAGRDAGGPIIASLLPSGSYARTHESLSSRHRSSALARDRVRATAASVRSTIVSIARSQVGVSSPGSSYCNPYSAYWGDGSSGCASGWRSNYWCADFAAWVWRQAGASFTHGWAGSDINAYSASFYSWGLATGNWHALSSGYQPQPGDVAVYGGLSWGGAGGHVGIYVGGPARAPTVVNGDWGYPDFADVYQQSNESNTGRGGGSLDGYVSVPNGTESSGPGSSVGPSSPTGTTGAPPATGAVLGTSGGFVDPSNRSYNVFVTTSGGINHYEKSPSGSWGGEVVATGSFTSAPAAFYDPRTGNYVVFVTTSGGLNEYEKGPSTSWGGAVVATGSFTSAPAAFVDTSNGDYNVFVTTGGGINQYENGPSSPWGGAIVATGSFTSAPAAFYDPRTGNYNVFATTGGGLNQYEKGPSTSWGGAVVATGSFTSAPAAFVDPSNGNYNVFVTTGGGINQYENGPSSPWGGAIVATGSFTSAPAAFYDPRTGDYNVFATTGGGINQYENGPSSPWGGAIVATGSFTSAPSAFVDTSNGDYNVFATTSGGINQYENGPSSPWGGAIVARTG